MEGGVVEADSIVEDVSDPLPPLHSKSHLLNELTLTSIKGQM